MIHALFDEGRRKEIQSAMRSGAPILFRNRAPKQEEPTGATASANRYEGTLNIGTPHGVGGFEFIYNGIVDVGSVAMCIKCGDAPGLTQTLPVGKESVVDFAPDGRRIRISIAPHGLAMSSALISITVEPLDSEND